MYRYTTPTIPITIDDIDFSLVDVFRVAVEKGGVELLFEIPADDPAVDAGTNTVYVSMTQEQTALFTEGEAEIQVRIRYTNGNVQATNKEKLTVDDVLDEVII